MTPPPTEAWLRRLFTGVGLRVLVANLVGATLSFVYLGFVSPFPPRITPERQWEILRFNIVVFTVFMTIGGVVVGGLLVAHFRRVTPWAREDRPPTAAEVDAVLRLPRWLLVPPSAVWLLASVLFGLLQLRYEIGWVLVARVATGIMLAGLITSSLTYLLVERALRPVSALVISYGVLDRPRAPGIMPRIVVSWLLSSALPLLGVGLTQLFRSAAERQRMAGAIWFLVAVGLVVGAVAMVVAAKSVAEPIGDVRAAQREVERGRLEVSVPVMDASEVGLLQTGFNDMVAGLRERRRLQDIFGRHVGEDVARLALERGVGLGGETRDVSVIFADVIGSTPLAQDRPPEELVAALNAFFAAVVESVTAEGGWVNKFAGDGALCVFGAPGDLPDHRARALRAACRLRERLATLPEWFGIDAGIGVSSGEVTAGNVGAEERFEYTVIGDPVNEAARLTELAKWDRGRVLASDRTVAGSGLDGWRQAGRQLLRGRREETTYYAPVG